MTRRKRRRTFNGSPADHDDTQRIGRLRTGDVDGATITWPPGPGLPGGIAYLAAVAVKQTGQDTQPLAMLRAEPRYQPQPAAAYPHGHFTGIGDETTWHPAPGWEERRGIAPAPAPDMFPALPVAAPAPASAEAAEPAVIGDALRLPVIWCEMPRCIGHYHDPASTGYADTRERAAAAGWRTDALGRLACPPCQQARADYRTPQPVAWHHKEVRRRWRWDFDPEVRDVWRESGRPVGGHPSEEEAFRLGVVAEYCQRVNREHPAWAEAMADATARHRRTAGAS